MRLFSPQHKASSPHASCWVRASAGTGKTKVLVDRILRLLLQNNNPERILCLTYTKAAAKEMEERITARLISWKTLEAHALRTALFELGEGENPEDISADLVQNARNLSHVLEQSTCTLSTIHGFCQGVLALYPFEADLSPGFRILEEREAKKLKEQALTHTLNHTSHQEALYQLSTMMSEVHVKNILIEALSARLKLRSYANPLKALQKYFDVDTPELSSLERARILELAHATLKDGPKTLHEAAHILANQDIHDEGALYDFFLTKDFSVRKKFTLAAQKNLSDDAFQELARRIHALKEHAMAHEVIGMHQAFYPLIHATLDHYQTIKYTHNALDFDDLLEKTEGLLASEKGWIVRQIEERFDHILIDEAQDTSPIQWRILGPLFEHFFDVLGENKKLRTVFVVGDNKQSIYSFQGADAYVYGAMQHHLEQLCTRAHHPFFVIPLTTCYRQGPEILRFVDQVFSCPVLSSHILEKEGITHRPFREKDPSFVVMQPLVPKQEKMLKTPWTFNTLHNTLENIEENDFVTMADSVADIIGKKLPSDNNRPSTYDDILILFKRRSPWMKAVYDSLKEQEIPCTSSHKEEGFSHLVLKDFLSLLNFLEDPYDDYTLACLLKSPIFHVSEEKLQELCINRENSLFEYVACEAPDIFAKLCAFQEMAGASEHIFALCHRLMCEIFEALRFEYDSDIGPLLEKFLNLVAKMLNEGCITLRDFLNRLPSYEESFSAKNHVQKNQGVRLMTIHGSKGLEAPIVILGDASAPALTGQGDILFAKDFYVVRSVHTVISSLKNLEKEADNHEASRLLYVALTRAKDYLILTGEENDYPNTWYEMCKNSAQTH